MKAAQYSSYGGLEVIEFVRDAPVPVPGEGQVLVEVHSAGLNPVDWKIRAGYLQQWVPLTFPVTIGGDFAGKIAQVGPGVDGWQVGDEVYGMASVVTGNSGSLAEYAMASAGQIGRKPRTVTDTEAAVAVLSGVSTLQAMDDTIQPRPGQKVLIHGGSGGIGSLAIQYARHLGVHVGTTARADRHAFVRELGASEVVDFEREPFETVLHDYDAVLDTVGEDTYERSFQVLKPGGVMVSMIEQPNAALMAQYKVRAVMQASDVSTARLAHLADLIDRGVLKVYIDRVFPLDQAQAAFEYLERGHLQSKVGVRIR